MTRLALALVIASAVLALPAAAQFVPTGDVQNDFPPGNQFADPGGMDIAMPAPLAGNTSGFDIDNLGLLYDVDADILFVGFDTFGVGGDADGDGDPATTSAALGGLGGTDQADFGGTETFVLGMDLDNDGVLDIVAGIPAGSDINGFDVATYNNIAGALTNPSIAFGTSLPQFTGNVVASPSASQPDVEFGITNFTDLVGMFHQNGQDSIGLYAFMGSNDDATIGDDYFPSAQTLLNFPVQLIECYPAPNRVEVVAIATVATGYRVVVSYGSLAGYGCCTLSSPFIDPAGKAIPILGNPIVNVGTVGTFDNIVVKDFGSNNIPGRAVTCKELNAVVPFSIPSGEQYHLQFLAYPLVFGSGPFLTSNVYTYTQP